MRRGIFMKIVTLTPTIAPLTSIGGLGDILEDLPKFLKNLGNEVYVITYDHQNKISKRPHEIIKKIEVKYQGSKLFFDVIKAVHPSSNFEIFAFSNPEINQLDSWDPIKYEIFADLVVSFLSDIENIECVSGHDWPCGLAIAKCHEKLNLPTTLTIHNEAFKGPIIEYKGHIFSFLEHGIYFSDAVNTVSPNHAEEIRNLDFLKKLCKEKPFHGIINGIDTDVYSPESIIERMKNLSNGKLNPQDYCYIENYDISNAAVVKPKIKESWFCKCENLKKYINDWNEMDKSNISGSDIEIHGNIKGKLKTPMIGFVGRATYQKGFDLIFETMPEVLEENNANFVLVSKGEKSIEEKIKDFAESYPDKIMALVGHCPPIIPIIYAGCDWTVVPSLWEPCGLTQMESMSYGTPVIARNTGGLSDTVISLHPDPHKNPNFDIATGVLFNDYDKYGFKWGIEHGLYWSFYNLEEACLFINYKHVHCPESPYEENSPLYMLIKNCYHHVQKNLSWQNNDSSERYRALFGGAMYKHYF